MNWHELAHVLETVWDVYNDPAFVDAMKEVLGIVDPMYGRIDDLETFVKPIERLRDSSKLLSIYQGRVYSEIPFVDANMQFDYRCLGDFFSEAYKEFLINPEYLKLKQRAIYDYISELMQI